MKINLSWGKFIQLSFLAIKEQSMKGSELVARIEKFEQNLNPSILSLSLYYHLSLIDHIFHSISQITFHRFYMICDFDLLVLTAVCFPSNKLIWNMRKKISKVFFFFFRNFRIKMNMVFNKVKLKVFQILKLPFFLVSNGFSL